MIVFRQINKWINWFKSEITDFHCVCLSSTKAKPKFPRCCTLKIILKVSHICIIFFSCHFNLPYGQILDHLLQNSLWFKISNSLYDISSSFLISTGQYKNIMILHGILYYLKSVIWFSKLIQHYLFSVIEHLPAELRDRFTEMREQDLSVQSKFKKIRQKDWLYWEPRIIFFRFSLSSK